MESVVQSRQIAGTDLREPLSFLDLYRHVSTVGLKAAAYKKLELKDLKARLPLIVRLSDTQPAHFVVLVDIGDRTVNLVDPLWGRRRMPVSTFNASWSDGLGLGLIDQGGTKK